MEQNDYPGIGKTQFTIVLSRDMFVPSDLDWWKNGGEMVMKTGKEYARMMYGPLLPEYLKRNKSFSLGACKDPQPPKR